MRTSTRLPPRDTRQVRPADSASGGTLLDRGLLPVEQLATLGEREGWRPRPIYQAHRWFARRFGSAFRALLVAARLPPSADFWAAYYAGVDYRGKVVLDPFVGGGTSVVEALRLGADVVGADVDAVACAITRFESRAGDTPDLAAAIEKLDREVGRTMARYYRTSIPGLGERQVLHYFHVQVVACRGCGRRVEAHPHFQLAYEAEGKRQWAFCPGCHDVQELAKGERHVRCRPCSFDGPIAAGPARAGLLTCPHCGVSERLIDVAGRTGRPPEWHLFALEVLDPTEGRRSVPMTRRHFRRATDADRRLLAAAGRALERRRTVDGTVPWVPERVIPARDRSDDRLIDYGYARYHELFNPRQLLHLSRLAEAIDRLDGPVREAMALAFSDHLTTNCMMTNYAFGWRRLAPLFSIRAFRHVSRPVELNPWLDGTGRGTYPNAVRQVQRAIESARCPTEAVLEGGFTPPPAGGESRPAGTARILHADARQLKAVADRSVDLVLTDPPYFDNIAYSELSDFFLPWLQLFRLAPASGRGETGRRRNLAARGRSGGSADVFRVALGECFRQVSRVLKSDGRLVFTYQHRIGGAWEALAVSLAGAGFRAVQVFPMLGNSHAGPHVHSGTCAWDAVFVAVPGRVPDKPPRLRLTEAAVTAAGSHCATWATRLAKVKSFSAADRLNLERACLVAAAIGAFATPVCGGPTRPLRELLDQAAPTV
jgi:putative DNA methylase